MNGTDEIIDLFHSTCCRTWDRDQVVDSALVRFAEAYLMMAEAHYRPAAPGDGCGGIYAVFQRAQRPLGPGREPPRASSCQRSTPRPAPTNSMTSWQRGSCGASKCPTT
jgi:hypothetical protein